MSPRGITSSPISRSWRWRPTRRWFEIPSPHSARVTKLCATPGDRITVGDPLVEFEAVGAKADTGAVVGEIDIAEAAVVSQTVAHRTMGKATPAVRALARTLGVDVSVVQGTGPNGAVTRRDVERAAKTLAEAGPAEPLRGVLRAMAERMARAHAEVVHASVTDEADVDAWPDGTVVMLRLIRAVVAGCRQAPTLNAWFESLDMARRLHKKIDLGIAVDIEDGLFVPVLRDVGSRDAADLQKGLEQLKADVRARKVPASELRAVRPSPCRTSGPSAASMPSWSSSRRRWRFSGSGG